ncbi:hypothetical protein ILYODFUR_017430, partial [Ilyodon furcidens]
LHLHWGFLLSAVLAWTEKLPVKELKHSFTIFFLQLGPKVSLKLEPLTLLRSAPWKLEEPSTELRRAAWKLEEPLRCKLEEPLTELRDRNVRWRGSHLDLLIGELRIRRRRRAHQDHPV